MARFADGGKCNSKSLEVRGKQLRAAVAGSREVMPGINTLPDKSLCFKTGVKA